MIKNLLNLLFMNDKDVDKMDDSIIQIRKQLENERQSQIQELNNRRDENLKQLFCMLANIEYDNIVVDLDQSKFSLDEDRLKSLIEKYQLSHDQDIPHLPDSFETLMSLSPLRGTAARNKSSLSQSIGDQSEQSSQIQSVDENEDIQSSQIPLSSAGASDESLPSKISALSNAMSIDDEEMVPIKEEDVSQAPSRAPSQTPEPSNEPLDKVKMEDGSMDANGNNVKKRKIVPPPIERPVTRGITREAKSRDGTPGLPTTPSQLSAPPDINEFTEASKATINQSAPHYASGASILQHLQRQTVLQPLNSEKVDERRIASYKVQARMIHNPMFKCLQTANKSVSTSDWTVAREELKRVRILKRVDELKAGNMWAFRQMKMHKAPTRDRSHWDFLLDEMKWMQVDFKKERRWKIGTAWQVSRWILEWHNAEDKSSICVKPGPVRFLEETPDKEETSKLQDVEPSATSNLTSVEDDSHSAVTMDLDDNVTEKTDNQVKKPDNMDVDLRTQVVQNLSIDACTSVISVPVEFLDDNITTYEPPNPNNAKPYCNEIELGRIIPITKLISMRHYFPREITAKDIEEDSSRLRRRQDGTLVWKHEESERAKPEEEIIPPSRPRIDPNPLVSLPFMRKPKEPTAHPTSAPTPSGAPWNSDEDDFLLKNAKEYQFNWELVADALNLQLKKGSMIRNDRRSPLECQQRYHKIESQSSGSQAQNHLSQVIQNASSSSTPNLAPSPKTRKESREAFLSQKAIKDGVKKRRIKHYSILDVIRRLAPDRNKHKTQQANPPNSQNATPEKIPMAPSPFELSELKFRRDEQLRKLQLERERQAQLAAAGSARLLAGRPPMALPPGVQPVPPQLARLGLTRPPQGNMPMNAAQIQAMAAAAQAQAQAQAAQVQAQAQAQQANQSNPTNQAQIRPVAQTNSTVNNQNAGQISQLQSQGQPQQQATSANVVAIGNPSAPNPNPSSNPTVPAGIRFPPGRFTPEQMQQILQANAARLGQVRPQFQQVSMQGNTNNTNPAKPGDAGSSGVPQQPLNVQAAIAAQYGQLTPAMAQKLHLAQQQQQHAQAFSNPHAVQNIQQAAAFAALQQGFNGYQAKNATGQTLPPMTPEAIALFNRQQQLNALNLQRAKSLANQPTQGASTVPSSQSTMQSNPQGTQDLTKSPTPGPAASPKLTAATTAPKSTSSDTPIPNVSSTSVSANPSAASSTDNLPAAGDDTDSPGRRRLLRRGKK